MGLFKDICKSIVDKGKQIQNDKNESAEKFRSYSDSRLQSVEWRSLSIPARQAWAEEMKSRGLRPDGI